MAKEASLPVRLDEDMRKRLDLVAKKLCLTKSALMRMLVETFVKEFEANGQITMPPQWKSSKPRKK